jgi:hypothetical protein
MNNQPTEPAPNSPHWRYIVAPFCLLLLCLGTINIANWLGSQPITVTAEATTAVTTSAASPATATTAVTLTPIPATATPTATRYSPPVYNASIRLLGPPNGAQFEATGQLSFYWQWTLPMAEYEYFKDYAVV